MFKIRLLVVVLNIYSRTLITLLISTFYISVLLGDPSEAKTGDQYRPSILQHPLLVQKMETQVNILVRQVNGPH